MINTDRKTTLWHKTKNGRVYIRYAACVLSKLQAHQKRVLNGVRPVYDKGIQRPWRSFQKRHPINFISSNFKSHRPLIYSVCLKRERGWIFWTRWYNLICAVAQHFEKVYTQRTTLIQIQLVLQLWKIFLKPWEPLHLKFNESFWCYFIIGNVVRGLKIRKGLNFLKRTRNLRRLGKTKTMYITTHV